MAMLKRLMVTVTGQSGPGQDAADRGSGAADILSLGQELSEVSVVDSQVPAPGKCDYAGLQRPWSGIVWHPTPVTMGNGCGAPVPVSSEKSPCVSLAYAENLRRFGDGPLPPHHPSHHLEPRLLSGSQCQSSHD